MPRKGAGVRPGAKIVGSVNPDVHVTLPNQEKFFTTASLKKSARAGTHLPNPTQEPYGYNPDTQFRHLFPALELPILKPPTRCNPDDCTSFGKPELPPHELFLGDNLYVLRQLPTESVDLIYIDPPFFSNRTYTQIWGDDNEVRSFNDIFQDGMFSYLAWLNARLWEMKRVLKPTGSIYVHCDWRASHYIKTELDKIFGYENFRNDLIWYYKLGMKARAHKFHSHHDSIFWYAKNPKNFTFNEIRTPLGESIKRPRLKFDPVSKKAFQLHDDKGKPLYNEYSDELVGSVWDILNIAPRAKERIGYPTQKPEALLERILRASSNEGEVVADFFMGGGTTGSVALKLGRRFIGCDISRVAVSVAASRLIEVGEELSGVTVTKDKAATLGLQVKPVADIRIGYVGSYPIEKFKGISDEEFQSFVLDLYQANSFTGEAQYIHGLANGKLVISVGPGDTDKKVTLAQVKGLVEESLRQFEKQLGNGEEKILQVIGWGFEPTIEQWKGQAITALNKQGVKMQIELISLSSETFRQRIFRQIGESNLDLKFNRLNQLLSFSASPYPGRITNTGRNGRKLSFRLEGAKPIGTGQLINCQWDFSFDGGRFASREHALNREGSAGSFKAVMEVEHEFTELGEHVIAARVQDNLDGEAITTAKLILTEEGHELISFK